MISSPLLTTPANAITTAVVVSGFASPVDIGHANDESKRVFVVEQGGKVRIVTLGPPVAVTATPFLDIGSLVVAGGERGLLGLAFHPQFRINGRLFVDYTRAADGATVIAEYRVSANNANLVDPASARVLLTIPQPFENHNGGALRFGPDGYLYVGLGDGGAGNDPGNRAQDRTQLLGKVLRIDVDSGNPYAIPAGNPFASGAAGRPEIWAYGLRNPWRFNFDRATGDFYIGDVGQDAYEEIDWFAVGTGAGANLGWRIMEGLHCTNLGGGVPCFDPSLTAPIVEYSHDFGCSITGGTVYRGMNVPALTARYVYADYCNGHMWSVARDKTGAWIVRDALAFGSPISTFGENDQGELYFAAYDRGEIRQLIPDDNDRVDVIEYYNAALDHYFITSAPTDINALDSGALKGWTRTGETFTTYAGFVAGFQAVCRFYIPPALGDSHFYSASPAECADVRARFPQYLSEGPTFMTAALPDALSGACPAGTVPVYRIWNQRVDSNHRYTISKIIRDQMIARGGISEGYGPDGVAMCVPQ